MIRSLLVPRGSLLRGFVRPLRHGTNTRGVLACRNRLSLFSGAVPRTKSLVQIPSRFSVQSRLDNSLSSVSQSPPRQSSTSGRIVRFLRRVLASGVFFWVLSKGSWGFLDDIQFVQGSKEEFLERFFPRPPGDEDAQTLQRQALERAFKTPLWAKLTNFVQEEFYNRWANGLTKLLPLGDVTSGNKVKIFKDGDEYLKDVWSAIENAKERVWVEIFTIKNDRVGDTTLRLLQEAADRGVDVVFIYDYIGSLGFDAGTSLHLSPNACVGVYNPVFPLGHKSGPTMGRDHRKVIIVDDVGYCGGRNLTEAYGGKEIGISGAYHDINVKLEGPCVGDLARAVLATLYQIHPDVAAAKELPLRLQLDGTPYDRSEDTQQSLGSGSDRQGSPRRASEGNDSDQVLVQVLRQNMRHELRSIDKAVRIILRDVAGDRCFITTPYFMPRPKLRRDLIKASRNGVDVRILTTGKPLNVQDDIFINFMQLHAHRHIYGKFLEEGVRIFEDHAALHSKTITVDGNLAVVGSFNFDAWSARRNQEITAAILDDATAESLEEIFCSRCEDALEITLDDWQKRTKPEVFFDWLCYHIVAFSSLDSLCVYRQEKELTKEEKETQFIRHSLDVAFEQLY